MPLDSKMVFLISVGALFYLIIKRPKLMDDSLSLTHGFQVFPECRYPDWGRLGNVGRDTGV